MRTSVSRPPADCPVAPPSRESTYARALHRACIILGGAPQLATYLSVGEFELRAWMSGAGDPPEAVFLAAVEIILLDLDDPADARRSRFES